MVGAFVFKQVTNLAVGFLKDKLKDYFKETSSNTSSATLDPHGSIDVAIGDVYKVTVDLHFANVSSRGFQTQDFFWFYSYLSVDGQDLPGEIIQSPGDPELPKPKTNPSTKTKGASVDITKTIYLLATGPSAGQDCRSLTVHNIAVHTEVREAQWRRRASAVGPAPPGPVFGGAWVDHEKWMQIAGQAVPYEVVQQNWDKQPPGPASVTVLIHDPWAVQVVTDNYPHGTYDPTRPSGELPPLEFKVVRDEPRDRVGVIPPQILQGAGGGVQVEAGSEDEHIAFSAVSPQLPTWSLKALEAQTFKIPVIFESGNRPGLGLYYINGTYYSKLTLTAWLRGVQTVPPAGVGAAQALGGQKPREVRWETAPVIVGIAGAYAAADADPAQPGTDSPICSPAAWYVKYLGKAPSTPTQPKVPACTGTKPVISAGAHYTQKVVTTTVTCNRPATFLVLRVRTGKDGADLPNDVWTADSVVTFPAGWTCSVTSDFRCITTSPEAAYTPLKFASEWFSYPAASGQPNTLTPSEVSAVAFVSEKFTYPDSTVVGSKSVQVNVAFGR